MPKKENRPGVANLKKKQEKEITEKKETELEELGDLFKKSAEKSKIQKHEGHEESGESELEEDVGDESPNLQAPEFHQFVHLSGEREPGAPVLERMALASPRPVFVGGIPRETGTTDNGKNSRDEFKYVPGAEAGNEPKYFTEPGVRETPERINFTREGRAPTTGFREEINQERFFMQSELIMESAAQESFEGPQRFDFERERKKDMLETEHKKYRPRLPKS